MTMNFNRRKAVMSRSIKLGHCVCDPAKPCPCDLFKTRNICTCAGERPSDRERHVPLTSLVHKAGCASKIAQADLKRILAALPPVTDPNVLLGAAAGDDAGIYQLPDGTCLVQTVDVFTPCVDDPHLFGRIAAANSLSDVYAMGGCPLSALSIVGFPIETVDPDLMQTMLTGGMETLKEAGCALIGGHSINDQEVKCGFAITGVVDRDRITKRGAARPGDMLLLTKPLGTGMISFAAQIGRLSSACLNRVGESMATLNRDASELMLAHGAHACTDVTGFGLMGHLVEMMLDSGCRAEINLPLLPVHAAVRNCIENEILPGGIERNQEYSMAWVEIKDPSAELYAPILYDAQTSGGLLISLPPENVPPFINNMQTRGHADVSIIGQVFPPDPDRPGVVVGIIGSRLENYRGLLEESDMMAGKTSTSPEPQARSPLRNDEPSCCASPPTFDDKASESGDSSAPATAFQAPRMFADFMKETNREGNLDARSKKLMSIALSIARSCEPCLKIHLRSAIEMGIPAARIDEAAWLAIAFCGAPAMMFYQAARREAGLG
ncbi:MAG TPA: selenide, water dikinase SelD [Candidatus Sumerlaeota bacterium]|nr:selenide, water dikinase SelD [Candidatus Sumerlaeota bacterium]